jgi:hypothetical protein
VFSGIYLAGRGNWSVLADGVTLYQNALFTDQLDRSGEIIVGGASTCPATSLPGPTSNVTAILVTDFFPEETSLGYQNLCTGVGTTVLETNIATETDHEYSISTALPAGEYKFFIADSFGDGTLTKDTENQSICLQCLTVSILK